MADWKKLSAVVLVMVLFVGLQVFEAQARSFRVTQIPNGAVNGCANCHANPAGGGARNAFGQAAGAGLVNGNVTWNAALAALDSDNDGFTNGQELGDPNGTGTATSGAGVTNPGDPNSKPQPQPPVQPELTPEARAALEQLRQQLQALPAGTGIDIGPILPMVPNEAGKKFLQELAGANGQVTLEDVLGALSPIPDPGTQIQGEFVNGTLTMTIDLPNLGSMAVEATLSADGRILTGQAQSPLGPIRAVFNRLEGQGVDNVAGLWEAEVLEQKIRARLQQEGTTVTGAVEVGGDEPLPVDPLQPGQIVWDPANSTYDGKSFVPVPLQAGVGAVAAGMPSASNPVGAGMNLMGVYAFGFFSAIPNPQNLAIADTDLSASPLVAGTDLVLRFNKGETDHVSFIGMVADASDLSVTGYKLLSPTVFEIRARVANPVLSEHNNPDAIDAAFGLIIATTPVPLGAFNFQGTVFATDMHWLDLEAPNLGDLPQTGEDVGGMVAAIAAKGVSESGGTASFTAFMPEAFFQFARDHGVDVTGGDCLGYRSYVALTGSDEGFFKLNDPEDMPFADANFDIDGDDQADDMWRYRITNSTWSRQALQFGLITEKPVGPGQIELASVTLGGQALQEGVANPPVAAGPQDLEVVFESPVAYYLDEDGDPEFDNLEILAFPDIEDRILGLTMSEDAKTFTATVDLPADATYQMVIEAGDEVEGADWLQVFYFGTTGLPDAEVSGSVVPPPEFEGAQLRDDVFVALIDPVALQGLEGAAKRAALSSLARAAKVIALQDGEEDDGDEILKTFVRVAIPADDLSYALRFVPDGTYVLMAVLDIEVAGEDLSLLGFYDVDEDGTPDFVQVEGGQGVTGIDIAVYIMEPSGEPVFFEATMRGIDFPQQMMFVETSEFGEVGLDVSAVAVYGEEGGPIRLEDLYPGTRIEIVGVQDEDGEIRAEEIWVIEHAGPQQVTGRVLSVDPPSAGRAGLLTLTGPAFGFDEFKTEAVGSFGRQMSVRDLRPQTRVVVVFEEPEEMGRPQRAMQIRVLAAGEQPPPPDPEQMQFVGSIGHINFEEGVIGFAQTFAYNEQTRFLDRDGNPIQAAELLPDVMVAVSPEPTPAGLMGARLVQVLRGADERSPERIVSAVFVTAAGEAQVNHAAGVPLQAEVRVRFDRPLTETMADAVEVFVYEPGEEGGDVSLQTQVNQDGELVIQMTLESDTIYEAFAVLENGADYFAVFTTSAALPTLEVTETAPAAGAAAVATDVTLSVTFNRALEDAYIVVLPMPQSGPVDPEDLAYSEDRMTISVDVELEADRTYVVVVEDAWAEDGFRLDAPFKSRFSTGAALGAGKVSGNFVLPPGQMLDPMLRNGIGYVALLPSDVDYENLEGDEAERIGAAFDVTASGAFEISNAPAGSYFVEGFVFIEGGPGGQGVGLSGAYRMGSELGVVNVADGAEITGIEISMAPELRLTESRPLPGKAGVPSGQTGLSLQFSEPLRQNRGVLALEMVIEPPIDGFDPRRHFRIHPEDPRRVNAQVSLAPDTDYIMLVFYAQGVSGAELFDVVEIPFSTRAQFVPGGISGTVSLNDASTPSGVVTLGDLANGRRVSEVKIRQDGTYEFRNVPAGTYGVFVKVVLTDGREVRGQLDAGGDGKPDPVALAEGAMLEDVALTVIVPEAPSTGEPGENAGVAFSFDFDTGAGDGKLIIGQVSAGEEFSVALYADGVSKLVGYDVAVSYDTTAIALQSVLEGSTSEGANILKKNDGLGAFIGRVGDGGTANLSAAILGPSEAVAVDGGGLLGVMEFVALETFTSQTDLTISSTVTLQGLTAADQVSSDAKGTVSAVTVTKAIGLSVEPDSVANDGSTAATITAHVLSLEGVLQDSDNSTVVTFAIASGSGTLSAETVTAASGVAMTSLTSTTAGEVTVQASAEGARTVSVTVKVTATGGGSGGTELPSGPSGPIALDLNLDAGDQEQRQTSSVPKAEDTVTIDIAAVSGAQGNTGFNVKLEYDQTQLEWVGFEKKDIFSGGIDIITPPENGVVEISMAIFGGTASENAGSLGHAQFKVLDAFTSETKVSLIYASYDQVVEVGPGGAYVVIGGQMDEPTPDFDGDGQVGFTDFIQFAQVFGSELGDDKYSATFDLDEDGNIGFTDFIQFASAFGKSVSELGKPAGLSKPVGMLPGANGDALLSLVLQEGERAGLVTVSVRLSDAVDVHGYGLMVVYDASALAFEGATGAGVSLFAQGDASSGVALVTASVPGEALLADVLRSDASVAGEGDLVALRFRVLDETLPGRVELAEALVSDGAGRIDRLLGIRLDDVRPAPSDYALSQNYPNPFNPETAVPFALPEAGEIRVVVYNVLGQEVSVLVQGYLPAGYHRAVWDGRNAVGRVAASGIYFVRMTTAGFSDVRKMLLLK